jgi:hypothetical protein
VAPAQAQAPSTEFGGAARLPEKTFMNKSAISLPVIVEERARACLKEIQLFVKEGPAAAWVKVQSVAPSATGFEYRMPHDGEYWYNVVTVDLSNVATPPDVSKEPPAVIVVLDTTKPHVELRQMPPVGDGICIKCDVQDANPNPLHTKFEYQTMNQSWWPVDALPNQPECFCIPRQAALSGMVKVTCTDRAMNTTTREFNMNAMGLINAAADTGMQKTVTPAAAFEPARAPAAQQNTVTTPPSSIAQDLVPAPATNKSSEPTPPSVINPSQSTAGAKWLIVNQPRVSLEYTIEDASKNNVGKVSIWITKDNGQSWDVLCDVPDKKSPVVFELPGEGVFGIRLVVTNSRGFGFPPPKSGDSPECIVELDMTKPHATLGVVRLGPGNDSPCVDINWQAEDKNLGTNPIDLYYSVSQQGPWTPIAKGTVNSGKYRWYVPQDIGRQVYVRLVATDLAGNSTRSDVSEAVSLDDGTRPVARIGNILSVPQAGSPIGN